MSANLRQLETNRVTTLLRTQVFEADGEGTQPANSIPLTRLADEAALYKRFLFGFDYACIPWRTVDEVIRTTGRMGQAGSVRTKADRPRQQDLMVAVQEAVKASPAESRVSGLGHLG